MKTIRRLCSLFLLAVLFCVLVPWVQAEEAGQPQRTTVLFTHDLHSRFLPRKTENGGESGGYARLKTALDLERARYPEALVLDGGDFSMGSLIQSLYAQEAPELRTMGAMGYDAVTAGNHEFDYTGAGFGQMLNAALLSGDRTPALLMANYSPAQENPDRLDLQRAMAAYGVRDSMLLERGGVTYGIFGLMGADAHDSAPTSGFELEDAEERARKCVDALREQGAQFIICLSHGGTSERKKLSEDQQLAEKVSGIDLIISGHTHTTLREPIVVGNTYIVSSGAYCENLGSITLEWEGTDGDDKVLVDYRLIPIDQNLSEDEEIAALIDRWKQKVSGSYLSRYNLTYDQVLARSGFDLPLPRSGVQEPNALGSLVAKSYAWAAARAEEGTVMPAAVAVTADGVLRAGLPAGDITVSQVFDVLSLGVGADGTTGYPLVSFYLTGEELRSALEVDASLTPLMPAAQLYTHGIYYLFNTHRMFFNRVVEARLTDGPLESDRLYRVVTGLYSAQMLGTVESRSFGLLKLTPKDQDGNPVTDFTQQIIRDKNGREVKEWYALASYLSSLGQEEGEPGLLPDSLLLPEDGKQVSSSWNPVQLLKNPNWLTFAALGLLTLTGAAGVLLIRSMLRAGRRRRYGGGYRRRRWFGR